VFLYDVFFDSEKEAEEFLNEEIKGITTFKKPLTLPKELWY
jgi:hypothetical protein